MKLNLYDEISTLKSVILGNAYTLGNKPKINQTYDPSSIIHLKKGTYPSKKDLINELELYKKTLENNEIEVLSLDNVKDCNQIYARDIGFVIDDFFFVSNILPLRENEIIGLNTILKKIDKTKIVRLPSDSHIEGGDVILDNEYVFIGYYNKTDYKNQITARTNYKAVKFIENFFPSKKIKAFELKKSINNPKNNALHLDCCFQPVGKSLAVVCKNGFINKSDYDWIINKYGKNNILNINSEEMSLMMCNFFSIAPNKVISDSRFKKVNNWLANKGIETIEIDLREISKQGGLFRCTTLPLIRK